MAETATEHVQIRALEHMTGDDERPRLRYAIEMRDRPGPAYKTGVYSDDIVHVQLAGGLMIAKARVRIAWRGEFSRVEDIRRRVDAPIPDTFWSGRPRHGYAIVAELDQERWIDPHWAGPRSYGYEWIVLENDAKRKSWLEQKEPPRGGESLKDRFIAARAAAFPTTAPEE